MSNYFKTNNIDTIKYYFEKYLNTTSKKATYFYKDSQGQFVFCDDNGLIY